MNGMRQSLFFVRKEPDYNMMMMSTFSGLNVPEGHKNKRILLNGEVVKFKYLKSVTDHYVYRGEWKIKIP